MGILSALEAGPKAREMAIKAVALDDDSAEAHLALAVTRTWSEWNWNGAGKVVPALKGIESINILLVDP